MKYAVIKEREGVGVQNEEKVIRDITVNNCSFGSHISLWRRCGRVLRTKALGAKALLVPATKATRTARERRSEVKVMSSVDSSEVKRTTFIVFLASRRSCSSACLHGQSFFQDRKLGS